MDGSTSFKTLFERRSTALACFQGWNMVDDLDIRASLYRFHRLSLSRKVQSERAGIELWKELLKAGVPAPVLPALNSQRYQAAPRLSRHTTLDSTRGLYAQPRTIDKHEIRFCKTAFSHLSRRKLDRF